MTPKFDYSRIVMSVIWIVGGFLILGLCILTTAMVGGKPVPDDLTTMMGTALGAMTALLVSTKGSQDTQNVTVTNKPNDPVPVTNDDG
jgi:hypothetical protein